MVGGGAASLRILKPVIKSLDDLQTKGLETRPAETAMSAAWCAIIRTLGPREVLSLVPLNLSESASGKYRIQLSSFNAMPFHHLSDSLIGQGPGLLPSLGRAPATLSLPSSLMRFCL